MNGAVGPDGPEFVLNQYKHPEIMGNMPFNMFDLGIVVLLVVGALRGRQSEIGRAHV